MTAFMNIVTILGILLTLYYIYRFRQHDKAQMVKETYPERVKLAQEAVALGESWCAVKQSDEICTNSGSFYPSYISRHDARNKLKALKAGKYDEIGEHYSKLKLECAAMRQRCERLRAQLE